MKATRSQETSVAFQRTIRYYTLEDKILRNFRHENLLKSHMPKFEWSVLYTCQKNKSAEYRPIFPKNDILRDS
jgi:hypothetical protein